MNSWYYGLPGEWGPRRPVTINNWQKGDPWGPKEKTGEYWVMDDKGMGECFRGIKRVLIDRPEWTWKEESTSNSTVPVVAGAGGLVAGIPTGIWLIPKVISWFK